MPKKSSDIQETIDTLKHAWRHRKGVNVLGRQIDELNVPVINKKIYLEHNVPGTIMDVVDVLWPQPQPKPLLTHKIKNKSGWHMIFTLPPGRSFKDVLNKQDYFTDACRAQVKIENKGGYLHLNICEGKMESYYPYGWNPEPYLKKMDLPFPVGYTATGLEVADLAAIPHLRVAGTTLTGKSNFLHNLYISLSMIPGVMIGVIDLALLEFSYTKKHGAFAADTETALKLLQSLEREMHRRRKILDAAEVVKVQEYTKEDLPFIVLIIDEFAFFNPEGTFDKFDKEIRKECHTICSNIAALARKVGIHIVVAMQRPDHKILPGQLKANLPGALSLKTIDRVNSEIILDNGAAADLPDIKGRAIWQVGNQQKEVQVMHLPVSKARKLLNQREGVNIWNAIIKSRKRLPPR